MIADGRVLLVELHQSDPQKYSPSSPVPWTWWKWSKIWLGEVMYYSKPLLWLILLWLACQNRPTPQIEVHHMLSESVMAKWTMNTFVCCDCFYYRVPMLHAGLVVREKTLLRCYFRLKSICLNDVLAKQKHCPRLCLSCFQLPQMVSSSIWGRLQSFHWGIVWQKLELTPS